MLIPAPEPPSKYRRNQQTCEAIKQDGVPGTWYIVAEYDITASARDAAAKLRRRNPDLEFRSEQGVVYGRKPE